MTVQTKRREIGNLVLENIPDIPKQLHRRLHHYHDTREAVLADWLPEGNGVLISTRFSESSQIHRVEHPGGCRHQITFFKEPVYAASACPDPQQSGFLFSKDIGGNESYQLFFYNTSEASYEMLTDGHSKHGHGIWNPAGTAFVYNSNKRNQVDQDIYLFDFAERRERLLLRGKGYWYPVAWAPDGERLTLINYRSINESHLYVLHTADGSLQPIIDQADAACQGGLWAKDGQTIYFSCDLRRECRELMAYELPSGTYRHPTQGLEQEVEGMEISSDGRQLALLLNEHGISRLHLFDTEKSECEAVVPLPDGVISNMRWHPSEPKLALTLNQAQSPADVFVLDTATAAFTRWTESEAGGLQTATFVKPELVCYPTFDYSGEEKRKIPAFYYQPPKQEQPSPVVIYIHGGPESQYRPNFSPAFQYYLNELGLAILAPNVRGSAGYGKHYLQLDNGFKREDAVRDIGKLLDWIDERPELDSSRVAVMGGSYGGYMVLASMAHYNDRLCCGIDIFGISNFVTFLQNTKPYRRELRRVEYGDERDPHMRKHLERISPTTNAHKITKPMMIVQGLNDPRVPASEAEQMVRAIRGNGGEAWYLLAKDEGHGFRKKTNRDFYHQAMILFLKRYLLKESKEKVKEVILAD